MTPLSLNQLDSIVGLKKWAKEGSQEKLLKTKIYKIIIPETSKTSKYQMRPFLNGLSPKIRWSIKTYRLVKGFKGSIVKPVRFIRGPLNNGLELP